MDKTKSKTIAKVNNTKGLVLEISDDEHIAKPVDKPIIKPTRVFRPTQVKKTYGKGKTKGKVNVTNDDEMEEITEEASSEAELFQCIPPGCHKRKAQRHHGRRWTAWV